MVLIENPKKKNGPLWLQVAIMSVFLGAYDSVAQQGKELPKSKKISEGMMSGNVFRMANGDFFVEPLIVPLEVGNRLIQNGFEGLVIDSPEKVETDKQGAFPLVASRVAESMDASRWLFKEFAVLTAMDVATGTIHAEFFIEQKFAKARRDLVNNPPPPGKVSQSASANLFKRLYLSKKPADYLVTVILLDQTSNRVRVKVGESSLLKDADAFEKAIGDRVPDNSDRIEISDTRNHLGKNPQLPGMEISGEPGIVGVADLIPLTEGNRKEPVLQLAYRIPYPVKSRIQPKGNIDRERVPVAIELLATGTKVPAPWVQRIQHLGTRVKATNGGGFIEGRMDVRLSDLGGLEANQIYYLYAFIGELMSKPIKLDWRIGKQGPN